MASTESPVKSTPGDISEAVNQLVQGKRHMLVQDYVSAVSSLEKACKLFAESYGETANECGEPYLYYGKALLELSRMETGVLGHALQGVQSEDDDHDDDDDDEEEGSDKESDDQVENPDNVTGEERELIVQQVSEALLENACELEKKMAEFISGKEKDKSSSSEKLSGEPPEPMDDMEEKTDNSDIKTTDEAAALVEDKTLNQDTVNKEGKETVQSEKPVTEVQSEKPVTEVQSEKPVTEVQSEKPVTEVQSEKPVTEVHTKAENESEEQKNVETVEEEKKDGATKEETKEDNIPKDENVINKESEPESTEEEGKEPSKESHYTASKSPEVPIIEITKPDEDEKMAEPTPITNETGHSQPEQKVPTEDTDEKELKKNNPVSASTEKMDVENKSEVVVKDSANQTPKPVPAIDDLKLENSVDKTKEDIPESNNAEQESSTDEPMETDTDPQSKMQDQVKDENEEGDESESIDEKSQDEAAPEDTEAGPSSSTNDKEKEDDITNLQLAWEVLELAKVIFERQSQKDDKLKMKSAEVLLKLGEVSVESENYTQAIEDLNSCLDIQKQHLTTDDRSVAETYYQLGLAFSLDNQFDNAVEHFTNAIRVLEERIANCRLAIEDSSAKSKDESEPPMEDPIEVAKREIEELEALLPDIKTKIEDTEDMKKNAAEAMKEAALNRLQENSTALGGVSSSPQASPSKPTRDVSHLVKRKRKPEEEVNDTNEEIKKAKSDVVDGKEEQITTNGTAINGNDKMDVPLINAS